MLVNNWSTCWSHEVTQNDQKLINKLILQSTSWSTVDQLVDFSIQLVDQLLVNKLISHRKINQLLINFLFFSVPILLTNSCSTFGIKKMFSKQLGAPPLCLHRPCPGPPAPDPLLRRTSLRWIDQHVEYQGPESWSTVDQQVDLVKDSTRWSTINQPVGRNQQSWSIVDQQVDFSNNQHVDQ